MIKGVISSCILIAAILLIRKICKGHIKQWLQYSLWLIVAIKLIVFPMPWIPSSFAIFSSSQESPVISQTGLGEDASNANNGYDSMLNQNNGMANTIGMIQSAEEQYSEAGGYENQNTGNEACTEGNAITTVLTKISALNLMDAAKWTFLAIWLLGSLMFAMSFVTENIKVRRMLCGKRKYYKQDEVPLEVYTVENLPTPCLFGGKIYTSPEMIENEQKKKHVLLHEYCHYLHHDNIWSFLRGICLVLYWWNPLVWIAARCSKTDCELACDEAVLARIEDSERINYGKTLISLLPIKRTNYFVIASTMEGGKHSMKDRITFISKKPKVAVSVGVSAVAIVLLVMVFTCIVKPGRSDAAINTDAGKVASTETGLESGAADAEDAKSNVKDSETNTESNPDTDANATDAKDTKSNTADAKETKAESNETVEYTPKDDDYYSVCTDKSAQEVDEFAMSVSNMFKDEDWVTLADNIWYPITIDDYYIKTKEDFLKKDWSNIFDEEFVSEIVNADPADNFANWQGIAMAGGCIWMNQSDEDLLVSSINFTSESEKEVTAGLEGHWEMDYDVTTKNLKNYSSLQEIYGTGLAAGSFIDFTEDGSFTVSVGMSDYHTGTYEETGDCVTITYKDDDGKTVNKLLTRGDQNDTIYIVYECYGEDVYFKKMAE